MFNCMSSNSANKIYISLYIYNIIYFKLIYFNLSSNFVIEHFRSTDFHTVLI